MTDLEKSIREIPELLKVLKAKFTVLPAKVESKQVKTKDGRILTYDGDTPQAGMDIMIMDEAGVKTPAPDGDYDTEAGIITVKAGKIIDVKMTEQPPAPAPVENKNEANDVKKLIETLTASGFEIITSDFKKEISEYPVQMKANKENFENEIKELKASSQRQESIIKDLFGIIEKLASAPSIQSEFKKQDGIKKPVQNGFDNLLTQAKELSKQAFKN